LIKKKQTEDTIRIDIPLSTTTTNLDAEEIKKADQRKKKDRIKRFLISFFVAIAIFATVAIAVFLYQNKDILSSRNIKRMWNDLWGIELKSSHFNLNLSETASFISFQGGMVICDASGLRVIDTEGIEEILDAPVFSSPIIQATDDRFLIFDQTTNQLVYSDGEKILLSLDEENQVQSAFISQEGLSVIMSADGYLSMAQVYNRNGKLILEYKTPDYFGILSCLSNDGETLLFVGMTATDIAMDAQLLLIDMDQSEVFYTLDLGEVLPLSVKETTKNVFSILSDQSVLAVDTRGNRVADSSFEGQSLVMYCWGDNGCTCLLERHQAGGRYNLNVYDRNGILLSSKMDNRTPNCIYMSEDKIAFAYEKTVELYETDLNNYDLFQFDYYVNRVAVSREGTLITQIGGSIELQ